MQFTRFQIMRARRLESERWERVRQAKARVASDLEQHQLDLLREQADPYAAVHRPVDRATLIAKIDECEREVVRSWGPGSVHLEPCLGTFGVLTSDPIEPDHPPGLLSRFLLWWRC